MEAARLLVAAVRSRLLVGSLIAGPLLVETFAAPLLDSVINPFLKGLIFKI